MTTNLHLSLRRGSGQRLKYRQIVLQIRSRNKAAFFLLQLTSCLCAIIKNANKWIVQENDEAIKV